MPMKSYRGYNTGNTLKRWSSAMLTDNNSGDGFLSFNLNRQSFLLDDLEFVSGVPYSLKKKQRWRLREYIRQRLDDEDSPFLDDFVELVEGQHDGRGEARTEYMVRKAPGQAAVRELHRKRGRINRRAMSEGEEENLAPDGRHVVLDIVMPSSYRSSFVKGAPRVHSTGRTHVRPPAIFDTNRLEEDQSTDDVQLQFLLDELEDELDVGLEGASPPLHNLVDFVVLKTAKTRRRSRRQRTKSDSSDEGRPSLKDRKIIIGGEKEVSGRKESVVGATTATWMELDTSRAVDLTDPVQMNPERLQFRSEQLRRRNLLARFGERYLEGDSTPRKFAISVGEQLGKDATAYLVFEEVDAGQDYSIFDVFLNANLLPSVGVIRLPKLSCTQDVIGDVEEFVSDCVSRVLHNYGDVLVRRSVPIVVSYEKRPTPLDDSKETRRVHALTEPDTPEWSKAVFNRQHSRPAASDDWELVAGEEAFELVDPVCGICFEPVRTGVSRTGDEPEAGSLNCSLNACEHQFCHDCWRKHLIAGIRQGLTELRCPENECSEAVDVVTVMRFVSLPVHAQHASLVETNQVESDPASVWCPIPSCGRAVRVTQPARATSKIAPLNVECACGFSFCFSCREEAHWPAPCSAYQMYKSKLQLLGDLGLLLEEDPRVVVKGKHCPLCRRFIEKNGGCNHMTCSCNAHFCWHCGKLLSLHTNHNMPCVLNETRPGVEIEKHEFKGSTLPPTPVRSKQYCNTVKWRAMRLNRSARNSNYIHLNRSAIRELLFKAKKRRGQLEGVSFEQVRLEAERVERNYEEILRIVEFCHVGAMSLVKTQMSTIRLLRSCAHKLTFLAASIRDCVTGQRPERGPRDEVLQKCFIDAQETVGLIQTLAVLRNPKLMRRAL